MKRIILVVATIVVAFSCSNQGSSADALLSHLKSFVAILEKNSNNEEKASAELDAYLAENRDGLDAAFSGFIRELRTVKDNPQKAVGLVGTYTQMMTIIKKVKTDYPQMFNNSEINALFQRYIDVPGKV